MVSGIWHYFACNTTDISNAKVINKYKTYYKAQTYYHIETDQGELKDNRDIWENKWSGGQIYDQVELGKVYDFNVDEDKVWGDKNVMKITSEGGPNW